MPSRLSSPVISVDMTHISKVDPSNVDNLFSMWTIFSKCAESLENGRRLENLSWRLWNRETFCCLDEQLSNKHSPLSSSNKSKDAPNSETFSDIPELSCSVESASSEDELFKERSGVGTESQRPSIMRTKSDDRYRGKEKHMTPVHLAKIMEDIDRNKTSTESWRSCKTFQQCKTTSLPTSHVTNIDMIPPGNNSTDSGSSLCSSHGVVRGFSPGRGVSSYRSSPGLVPILTTKTKPLPHVSITQKKTKPVFYLGSSSSPSDDDLEDTYTNHRTNKFTNPFGSPQRSNNEKKTAFRDEVTTRTVYDDELSTDDDAISESAIEEEDCSDWESSNDSIHSSYDGDVVFKRVESRPQLTSRRSLLSTMLHEPDRAAALANAASRSTPVPRIRNGSPMVCSAVNPTAGEFHNQCTGIARSKPIIMTTTNAHPPALSPRTTRRNMLASELTESLRKHLLWERQQKNTTASAHLKRRHTAHDVTKLTKYPTNSGRLRVNTSKNNSWNNQFDQGHNGYHAAGW